MYLSSSQTGQLVLEPGSQFWNGAAMLSGSGTEQGSRLGQNIYNVHSIQFYSNYCCLFDPTLMEYFLKHSSTDLIHLVCLDGEGGLGSYQRKYHTEQTLLLNWKRDVMPAAK